MIGGIWLFVLYYLLSFYILNLREKGLGFWTDAPTQENEILVMMAYDWKRITQLIELGGKGIYYDVNDNGWLTCPCDWSQPWDSL